MGEAVRSRMIILDAGGQGNGKTALLRAAAHEADPDDVPVLPDLVALAMSVLLRSVDVPGSVSRPHTCEASAIVRGHFRVGADDAPVHGYPRPVTA